MGATPARSTSGKVTATYYHCSIEAALLRRYVVHMDLHLNFDQRARLELIAMHAGTSTEQLLLEAAELVLDRDASDAPAPAAAYTQRFLSEVELDGRFHRLLRQ
jgi:hypothetical protein